jgi:hypothetical protein
VIARFFVELAVSENRGQKIPVARLERLHDVLRALAEKERSTAQTAVYQVDATHTGYLRRQIADVDVFVPFHLARYFPPDEILDAVIEASERIALDNGNPICISGSAAFLGAQVPIVDLDFCEYAIGPQQDVLDGLHRLWTTPEVDFLLVKTKVSSEADPDPAPYLPPWPVWNVQLEAELTTKWSAIQARGKLDGVYGCNVLNVLPISNLVLPLDPASPEAGSVQRTFVYQEAVVVAAGSRPPRDLVNSSSLGKYLDFLKREAEAFVSADPLKALKRCLSFFLLTDLREPAETIIEFLQTAGVALVTEAKRQAELDGIAALAGHELGAVKNAMQRLAPGAIAFVKSELQPRLSDLAARMVALVGTTYEGVP